MLKSDARANVFELMQFDGSLTDLPVIEHVVGLAFDYFADPEADGAALIKLDPAILTDGPWSKDASGRFFDRDVLRIRRVHVRLRLESADPSLRGPAGALFVHAGSSSAAGRVVPDEEIEMHVALRNPGPSGVYQLMSYHLRQSVDHDSAGRDNGPASPDFGKDATTSHVAPVGS